MFAQPKRKSKSSKEKNVEKDKIKHEKCGSAKRIEVAEKTTFKQEIEVDKKKTIITASVTAEIPDDNSNTKINNPLSRDISIEGQIPLDTQIERGIMNLLEQEMARVDKKQYPPRPQSLSFYEDEFTADDTDLSGQLQALSPAEKQAIVNRTKNNFMTINANIEHIDQLEHKNGYDKSPKHDHSLGNSREKIVSDQKKSKKQRRGKKDYDAASTSGGKKSRRRNQSFFNEGYQPKTDITMALEDLQDDVFEGPAPIHGYNYGDSPKSPHYYGGISPPIDIPTKIYIDNNHFGSTKLQVHDMIGPKTTTLTERYLERSLSESSEQTIPLDVAILLQRIWMPFSTFCHGLLAGVALMNYMMIYVFKPLQYDEYVMECLELDEYYKILFFVLCTICIISVFDRYDLAHLDMKHVRDLIYYRKSCVVVPIYLATFACFLLSEINRAGNYKVIDNDAVQIIKHERVWLIYPFWTAFGTVVGWFILSCSKYDDLLGIHLNKMNKYTNDEKKTVK